MQKFAVKFWNVATAFFGCWAIQLTTGITVRNPLTVVLFVALFCFKEYLESFCYKGKKNRLFLALSFAAPAVLGAVLAKLIYPIASAEFTNSLFRMLTFVILFAGYFSLAHYLALAGHFLINRGSYEKLKKPDSGEDITHTRFIKPVPEGKYQVLFVLTVSVICFLCYLPYYLYEYPGIMTADSLVQYQQIIGEMEYSNHHPVVHTLIIKLFYETGMMITGDPVKAISFYTLFQMVFMSFCYGLSTLEIAKVMRKTDLRVICPIVAFFALFPVNAVFAVTLWKDVPFAGIAALLSIRLIEMYKKLDEGFKLPEVIYLTLLFIIFSLFRSNAFYAFAALIPFALYIFRKRIKEMAAVLIVSLLAIIFVKGPIFSYCGVQSPDFVESLSVPLQQMARVLVNDRDLPQEDIELIDSVIDRTYIKELYVPGYADNIKELVRAGNPDILDADRSEYLALYIRTGLRYPADFFLAWFDLVGGYIYPDVDYRVGDVDGIMGNDLGLYSIPIIGGKFIKVKEILLKLGDFMPLYGMLFSTGAYTWCLVLALIYSLKKKDFCLIHILMLLLVSTLLVASPVVDYRYEYAVVVTSPVWAVLSLKKGKLI